MEFKKQKLKVVLFPYSKKLENPYQSLIAEGLIANNIEVIKIPNRKFFPFFQIIKHKPDIIHLFWPDDFYIGKNNITAILKRAALQLSLNILRKQPTIYSADNLLSHSKGLISFQTEIYWINKILKNCSGIIFSTVASKQLFTKTHYNTPIESTIIPHVSFTSFYPKTISSKVAKEKLNLKTSKTVVIIGRIAKYKGIEDVIQAFNLLDDSLDVSLVIAGKFESNTYYLSIKNLFKETSNIKMINEYISNEDLQIYLTGSEALIINYNDQPLNPGTIVIAKDFGISVIAPEQPVVKEMLEDHLLYTFKHNDINGIANAITRCLEDKREKGPITKSNFNSPEQVGQMMYQFYLKQIDIFKNRKNNKK